MFLQLEECTPKKGWFACVLVADGLLVNACDICKVIIDVFDIDHRLRSERLSAIGRSKSM